MTKNSDEKVTVLNAIELDLGIEELEAIIAPGIATSPGPILGGLANHNETMVRDLEPGLEQIEELEEKNVPQGVIITYHANLPVAWGSR